MRRLVRLVVVVLGLGALAVPSGAAALPANPWTGTWLASDGTTTTLTQTGTQIMGTSPCPGMTSGVILTATASADSATASFTYGSTVCPGAGGTFTGTLSPDGRTVRGSGVTQYGTGFSFSWTYQGGGTEPRVAPAAACPGGAWSGRWGDPANPVTLAQSGGTVSGTYTRDVAGRPGGTAIGTVSGATLSGTWRQPSGSGTFTYTLAVDGRSFTGENREREGTTTPVSFAFIGCLAPAPDLTTSIPAPQTLANGPTTLVVPGRVSLRSLKRSKCVLVKVATRRPARILVSIFSGRRSIRLFGQRLVVFAAAPARRQVCITVPFRARTFNVRTPLRVALGYTAGAQRQRRGPKPPPVIRPIRLVP
jgi:hypothetical protein